MTYADTLRRQWCSHCCYPAIDPPDKKNTLTYLITNPFGALDKKNKIRYINYLKKMKQKYDLSSNVFTDNYLNIRRKHINNNMHIKHGCWNLVHDISSDPSIDSYTEQFEIPSYSKKQLYFCCVKRKYFVTIIFISLTCLLFALFILAINISK